MPNVTANVQTSPRKDHMSKFKIREWLEALESGEYRQGKDYLHLSGRYCCLGV